MISVNKCVSNTSYTTMLVGVGCATFLLSNSVIVGSVILSSLLLFMLVNDLNLYTNKSCTLSDTQDARRLILVLVINLIGVFAIGFLFGALSNDVSTTADKIVSLRSTTPASVIIIKSIITGVLTSIAVRSYSNGSINYILALIAFFSIIYTDCMNCVFDAFYFGASNLFYSEPILLLKLLIVVVCNFIGCTAHNLIMNKSVMYS